MPYLPPEELDLRRDEPDLQAHSSEKKGNLINAAGAVAAPPHYLPLVGPPRPDEPLCVLSRSLRPWPVPSHPLPSPHPSPPPPPDPSSSHSTHPLHVPSKPSSSPLLPPLLLLSCAAE